MKKVKLFVKHIAVTVDVEELTFITKELLKGINITNNLEIGDLCESEQNELFSIIGKELVKQGDENFKKIIDKILSV